MRKTLFAALLIAAPVSAQQQFDFSIKNIMRGPELYGRVPQDVRWSADSKWIYFNWVEPGSDWRETPKRYRVRAVPGAKPERVTPAQFDSAGALVSTGDRSGNGRYMAVEYGGDIYVTDMQRGTTRRLTQTNVRERQPQFSTDASRVYFIRENNVFSIDLNTGLLRQHTDLRHRFSKADRSARPNRTAAARSVRGDPRSGSSRQYCASRAYRETSTCAENVLHAAR
jgi:Tol biopolymer transport system component